VIDTAVISERQWHRPTGHSCIVTVYERQKTIENNFKLTLTNNGLHKRHLLRCQCTRDKLRNVGVMRDYHLGKLHQYRSATFEAKHLAVKLKTVQASRHAIF
jgi:hypothetical protein